jgi:hypothetical protein
MADIYRQIQYAPDQLIGRVEADGRVIAVHFGPDHYVGKVVEKEGKVYRHVALAPDAYLGHVTDDGRIYAHRIGPDLYVGQVREDGAIFRQVRMGPDVYLGKVTGMTHVVEGAAALLLFFLPAED